VPLRLMLNHLAAARNSLVPSYLAMGLLSIGDFGTLAWMPSVLSRRFAMPQAELGEIFGAITAVAGVLGALLGGIGSDVCARWYGTRGRLFLSLVAALLASASAVLICSGRVAVALSGLGLWTFCSGLGALSGIAAAQNLVPSEYRGVGIGIIAFCNTLLGLGVGPTLVAVITEQVYRDPVAVGAAITTTALPAGLFAATLFWFAARPAAARE
jgi:MFS family permease